MNANRSTSVSSAFGWTTFGQIALGGTRLIVSVGVGRLGGPELLGETTALLSVSTFALLSLPQSLGVAATKFMTRERVAVSGGAPGAIGHHLLAVAWLLLVPLCAASTMVARTALTDSWVMACLTGLLVLSMGFGALVRGVRNARGDFRQGALWDLIGSAMGLVALGVVAGFEQNDWVLLPIVITFLPAVITGWPGAPRFARPELAREIRTFYTWTSMHILAAGSLLPLVTLIGASTLRENALGHFSAAASIATPAFLLMVAMLSALTPRVAGQFASGQIMAARGTVDALLRIMIAMFVPILGLMAVWAPWGLNLLYGSDFAAAWGVLAVMLAAVGVSCINAAHLWLSSTHSDGPRKLAKCNASGLLVGVVSAMILSPILGPEGAAAAVLLGCLVSTGACLAVVWRNADMHWAMPLGRLLFGVITLVLIAALVPVDAHWIRFGGSAIFLMAWLTLQAADVRLAWTNLAR